MLNPLQLLFGHPATHSMLGPATPHPAAPSAASQPFVSIFGTELQNLQLSAAPLGAASPTGAELAGPGQVLAGGGELLPGTLPPGAVIEVFSYSRIMVSDASGMLSNAMELGDPRAELAHVLSQLGGNTDMGAVEPAQLPLAAAVPPPSEPPADESPSALSDRIDRDELSDRIGQSVARLTNAGIPDAELAVRHPRFGWIEVSVSRDAEGVSLSFGIEDAALRGELEAGREGIAAALEAEGLPLVSFTVEEPDHAAATVADTAGDPADVAASAPTGTGLFATALDSALTDTALRLINARA